MSLEQKSELDCTKTTEQPDWGEGHIRSVKELNEGKTYLYYSITLGPYGPDGTFSRSFVTTGTPKLFTVRELPKDGGYIIDAIINNTITTDLAHPSLAILGLEAFPDGTWARWDWLQDPLAIQNQYTQVSRSLMLKI